MSATEDRAGERGTTPGGPELRNLAREHRGRFAAATLATAVGSFCLLAMPLVARDALDGALGGEALAPWLTRSSALLAGAASTTGALASPATAEPTALAIFTVAALATIALALVAGAATYLRGRWSAEAAEGIARSLRERLFRHIERLPCTWHDAADTGDTVQRCTSDVETVRVFFANQVVEIGRTVLAIAIAVPLLASMSPTLAVVSVALFPPIVVFAVVYFRRVRDVFRVVDEAEGELTSVIQENLTGLRVVRAFARQAHEEERVRVSGEAYRDAGFALIRVLSTYWAISDLLCLAQAGLVLFAGAWMTANGELTPGALWAFISIASLLIWPVRHMGRVLSDMGKALVAAGRIAEVLEAEPETSAPPRSDSGVASATTAPTLTGRIRIEGLHFGFDSPVLDGIDLQVEAGETVVLLGPPGAGKSTLVHLLLRLYDYERGSIRLDGHELSGLDHGAVREQIAVVLQEPFLYSRSIGENVRLGHPGATFEELAHSAESASIHSSVMELEEGYETLVGERGVTLSGGQRQRLALARALLLRAPILVLDDALSAVDAHTEAHILSALEARRGQQTTLIIAHRLSTAALADRVVVLQHGRVVQDGPPTELTGRDGPYRRLLELEGLLERELERDLEPARAGGEGA